MNGVRYEDVKDRAGAIYDLVGTGVSLTLAQVEELPVAHGRDGGAFRLEFTGPADPMLPQAIYAVASDGVEHDIFLVPIARDQGETRYEAVFN